MLKRIHILVLFILITSCQNEEQISYPEYYRSFNQIKEYLNAGEIQTAIRKFDDLSKKISHIPSSHFYKMASACAENNLCVLSAKYLKKSFQNGYEYPKKTNSNKSIINCSVELKEIFEQEIPLHQLIFNYEYKSAIDSMFQVDQKARMESDYEVMRIIDSLNMLTLLSQIKKIGYPSEKLIGHNSASRAFILILHMDRDKKNQIFKPILDKAYNEGFLHPRGYAWIADRRRAWGDEELEPYYYHMPSKKYDNFSLEQINEINKRRDSIGLEPN